MQAGQQASVLADQVARFDALAARWWDPAGPMRPLHAMNSVRVGWILRHLWRARGELHGLRLLDVGCGAGLAAESLAGHGCDVTGIDAAGEAIEAARAHAAKSGLSIAYSQSTVEVLAAAGQRFQAVTALEVIEHVADPTAFLRGLAAVLEPGGQLFLSTLNRTARSFLLAKLGAEYVLRWLPRGTHDWQRFLTPAEVAAGLRLAGLRPTDFAGLSFDPIRGRWLIGTDLAVNYILCAEA